MENKQYGIMLDTETANTIEEEGKLDTKYVLPYDIGFAVIDTEGNIYEQFSFVNSDIFIKEFALMQSAYYVDKIPQYIVDLANGTRTLADTLTIRKALLNAIKKYECTFIVAHNSRFDLTACNNIQRWTTKSKYRYFFPYGIEIWDTLKMAREVFKNDENYIAFCHENGYVTKHKTPRPQMTAEVIYRYLTGNTDFIEEHTGLEDVLIEVEIFKYCMSKNPTHRKLFEEN